MDHIHRHPTLVGEIGVFDLTHRATSTKVPERTVAGVAVIQGDGKIVCSTYQAMAVATRLVDRFVHPAEGRGRPPRVAGAEVELCAPGWTYRGRRTIVDDLVQRDGYGPRRLDEMFGGRTDAVVEVGSCPRRLRDYHESIRQLDRKVRDHAEDLRARRAAPVG